MALTSKEIGHLARTLDELHARNGEAMRDEVARTKGQNLSSFTGGVSDVADEAAADLYLKLDAAEATRAVDELRAVDAARARIADGSYGVCEDCGADIGLPRLRAQPTATRCVACQDAYERTHFTPGRPSL